MIAFHCIVGDKKDLLAEIRIYKNSNAHIKLNQDFMRAWNIEAARLNGWIKAPSKDSADDMAESINDLEQSCGTHKQ